MPAAVVINNLVDATAAVVTASNSIVSAPPSNLREEHVARKWRDNAASTFILVDLGSSQSIDTHALMGLSGGGVATGTYQLRLSSVDSTGAAGDVFNSGAGVSLASVYDVNYGTFGFMHASPLSARYVRLDLAFTAAPYIEAGRWLIGARQQFGISFEAPWQRSAVRNSATAFGVGGQSFVDRRPGYWTIDAHFAFLNDTDRTNMLEQLGIAIVNTGHKDFLWINDTATSFISRDFIWGYIDGPFTMSWDKTIFPAIYSVEFPIRQRL